MSITSNLAARAAHYWQLHIHPAQADAASVSRAAAPELEPGLIRIYRLFALIHLLVSFAAIAIGTWVPNVPGPDSIDWATVGWVAVLMVYLCWPGLQARLGRAYLPFALVYGAVMPLVMRIIATTAVRLDAIPDKGPLLAASSSWQLFLALLIPLLLIGWQYSFTTVFGYILLTTVVDLAILHVNGLMDTMWLEIGSITFSRTIIFLFAGFVVTQLMAAQRAQRRKLAAANLQLLHHAATSEQLAVSRERNRLARELHDTLAHTLSALSVQLEAVDSVWDHSPDRARDLLHKSLASTRSGLTETRRALQALRASPLEDLGLTRALRSLAESAAARVGARLEMQLPEDVGTVSPDVEQTVYRIAQEALSNTTKHSAATQINLSLVRYDNHLLLDVRDNGCGFDPVHAETAGHYGLSGMRERAELVGGALEIKSAPGQGTSVRLAVST